jgi:hypothetical protein
MLRIALASCIALLATTVAGSAQENPKRQKCLQEAMTKGLWNDPNREGSRRANVAMKDQREVFMKECVSRR